MSVRRLASVLVAVGLGLIPPIPVLAQIVMGDPFSRYGQYGDPIEVPLEDIARGFGYNKRAVITQGVLDTMDTGWQYFRLRDEGAEVLILAVPNAHDEVRRLIGREVEVTGLVREVPYRQGVYRCGLESQCNDPNLPPLPSLEPDKTHWPKVSITVWGIVDLTPPPGKERKREYKTVSLESLVMNPGERDGQTLRVIGQFRGKNLYGDLPVRSQRTASDWVIKDDAFAVWVTGKRPRGQGFALDPSLKRDTGKWMDVVGRVETRNGITYIRALQVALTSAPTPTAKAEAPAPPPERPKVPPVVVFALPLDGEVEVSTDSRFVVQFSKDMDESTFSGHVLLRYVGPVRPGDRAFDGVKLTYDPGRRALTVDPGDVLRPGRELELLLLPGILDTDGLGLTPRPGHTAEAELAVDVFRYQIGG